MEADKWAALERTVERLEANGHRLLDTIEYAENIFKEHAAISMFEKLLDHLDNTIDLLDDSDWESIAKEISISRKWAESKGI